MADHVELLNKAHRMIASGDIAGLADVTHTLRGMIGNFAAPEASKAAERLYKLAHRGEKDKAAQALDRLQKRLSQLIAALAQDIALPAASPAAT